MDPRDFMAGMTELGRHLFYDGKVIRSSPNGLVVGPVRDPLDTAATKKMRTLGWLRIHLNPDIWLCPLEVYDDPKKSAPVAPGAIDTAGAGGAEGGGPRAA